MPLCENIMQLKTSLHGSVAYTDYAEYERKWHIIAAQYLLAFSVAGTCSAGCIIANLQQI